MVKKPIEFVVQTDDAFAQTAARSFSVVVMRSHTSLRGPCPRCGDPMDYPIVSQVLRREEREGTAGRHVSMICTCVVSHRGTPEDDEGCGAYWNLELVD